MKPIQAVVMGFGDRGQIYAGYAKREPQRLRIVGAVDPDPIRLEKAGREYGLPSERLFTDPAAFYAADRMCDAVINATMDRLHVATTLPLLEKGYDVLLEKPITSNIGELMALRDAARRYERRVMVCHVLRYAPFYTEIKKLVSEGAVGRLTHIYASENVAIPHMLSSYVRGKWSSERLCGSGMLMAKCCHDVDLIVWLAGGDLPQSVFSAGKRSVFVPENRPEYAGERCLDCTAEPDCPYSAKKLYLENDAFPFLVWAGLKDRDWNQADAKTRTELLKTTNPHGLCAYTQKDLVDHQTAVFTFRSGLTATLDMTGGTSRPGRRIHIVGDCGEIEGFLEENRFILRQYDPDTTGFSERVVEISEDVSGAHSGGDLRLVADFIELLSGGRRSISCTDLEDSVTGHLLTIGAELSRRENRAVAFSELITG